MTIDTTYLELYAANQEVNQFVETYPIISKLILGERVVNFPKNNAVYLNLMYEKIRKLYETHVELKDDGSDFAMTNTVVDDGFGNPINKVEPKYKDGHRDLFQKEWAELMNSHCKLTV